MTCQQSICFTVTWDTHGSRSGRSYNFENVRMDNSFWLHDVEWSETFNKLKKISKTALVRRSLLFLLFLLLFYAKFVMHRHALQLHTIRIRTTFAITMKNRCQKKDNNFIIIWKWCHQHTMAIFYGNNGKHGQYDWK